MGAWEGNASSTPPFFPPMTNISLLSLSIRVWSTCFRECGSTLPDDIVTTAAELTIRFTTDGSVGESGFKAVYTVSERESLPVLWSTLNVIFYPGRRSMKFRHNISDVICANKTTYVLFNSFCSSACLCPSVSVSFTCLSVCSQGGGLYSGLHTGVLNRGGGWSPLH